MDNNLQWTNDWIQPKKLQHYPIPTVDPWPRHKDVAVYSHLIDRSRRSEPAFLTIGQAEFGDANIWSICGEVFLSGLIIIGFWLSNNITIKLYMLPAKPNIRTYCSSCRTKSRVGWCDSTTYLYVLYKTAFTSTYMFWARQALQFILKVFWYSASQSFERFSLSQ